jgi:hypothetical protein
LFFFIFFFIFFSKRWLLKKSSISHPLRGCTPHYKNIDTEEQQLKIHNLTDPNFSWASKPAEEGKQIKQILHKDL